MSRTRQPLILHVPHSSREIPREYRNRYLIGPDELEGEMDRLVDFDTEKLFRPAAGEDVQLVFPWSRLFMDVERFEKDADEPMAERGMGVLYSRTIDGRLLRPEFSPEEREELLDAWYRPWHRRLEETAGDFLERYGAALIIDCHSFPDVPLACDMDQLARRPDICLGTDDFHTPEVLLDFARGFFEDAGFGVMVNRPYAGTMVPLSRYGKDARVSSLMVEVNRRLYGKGGGTAGKREAKIYGVLEGFLREAGEILHRAAG